MSDVTNTLQVKITGMSVVVVLGIILFIGCAQLTLVPLIPATSL